MKVAKKQVLAFVFLVVISLIAVSFVSPAHADQSLVTSQIGLNEAGDVYGSRTPTDIRTTIARIINVVLGFLGVIFVVLTIVAGFQYMTAAGNEEKTKQALGLIKNAVIGLVIVLMSWMLTRFIVRQMSRATNGAVDYTTYTPYTP
ncbi:MAG: pilin [Patescibacteria group bacterium]|jgi:hypothetical protein